MDALEFSQSRAYFFIKMSRDLEELPKTKKAVENGEIEWTKVREVTKVEPKIGKSFSFSVEQMERFNVLMEKLRKTGETGTNEELLIKSLELITSENSTRVEFSSTQIVIRHCPDCGKAETGAGEISQNDLEKAYCDAHVLEHGRNRATIRPSVRREVMSRDNHTCQGQGYSSKRYLEVHHKIPRALGGSNDESNLITLCSACHRLVHNRQRNYEISNMV